MPKWYACPHSEAPPDDPVCRAAWDACKCRADGGCAGQLRLEVSIDDPSPPGVGLSPGHYTYAEIVEERDHECDLTSAETDAFCQENAADVLIPDEDDWR